MTLTQCGPVCDVGGEYILLEGLQGFSVAGLAQTELHVCEGHLLILKESHEQRDWKLLPDGPLRKAWEKVKP